ncbi:hypothetical protein H0H93_014606 [Arthromyces matolae]|nr:hypothetical protein H0H93_014606 [Arthromyces matolae]
MAHPTNWQEQARQLSASVLDAHSRQTDAKTQELHQHRVLVKNPPRDQLPAGPAEDSAFLMTHFPGNLVTDTSGSSFYLSTPDESHVLVQSSPRRSLVSMARKRRSLQSLFIPSFLTAPPSPTTDVFSVNAGRARSHSTANQSNEETTSLAASSSSTTTFTTHQVSSPRNSPPPAFLLDDDPFANLSAVPAFVCPSPTPVPTPINAVETPVAAATPRSPLTPVPDAKPGFLSSPPPVSSRTMSGVTRTLSGRVRPAYSKPAFVPRPSLPSLDTLARMNYVRKGRVGARLPHEPWNQPDTDRSSSESSTTSEESSPLPTPNDPFPVLFASSNSKPNYDTLTSGMDGPSTSTSQGSETLFTAQGNFSYGLDSELSSDSSDFLDDDEYITSSELSYLSRSTSDTSLASSDFDWPSFTPGNHNSNSFSEDSDTLNFPLSDLDLPESPFDSHNIISSYWSSDDLLDSLNGTLSTGVSYSELFKTELDMQYEPGTSAGTIRPSNFLRPQSSSPPVQRPSDHIEQAGGSGRENGQASFDGRGESSSGSSNTRNENMNIGGSGWAIGNGTSRFGGRGDDEDEDDKRNRVNNSKFSTPSDSEASASDEDSADDYGEPVRSKITASSSDDDVPLAQRIPNALKAQNTIRRQVQEEREQRRAARAAAAAAASPSSPPHRPLGAGEPKPRATMSSSQEAALHASTSLHPMSARTFPTSEMPSFSPDELAKRLQSMEKEPPSTLARSKTSGRGDTAERRPGSAGHGSHALKEPSAASPLLASPILGSSAETRPLRPARSFHRPRPEGRRSEEHHAVPLPIAAGRKLARSLTRKEDSPNMSPRSFPIRLQEENSPKATVRKSMDEANKLTKHTEPRSTRSSSEQERPRKASPMCPPVPPLPAEVLSTSSPPAVTKGLITQQRVFIGDMQRFNMIEIGPSTSAGDVLQMVDAQGSLKGWVGSGDWMVWEVAQDFGMERPVRSFELLSDVQASWNKDKLMNTFVIKLTPLAAPLSRSAMPSSSPTFAGYVEWESKRGKWSKRWLQLREHSLWLSKRDNGRDEVLLCSLSNFDAYFITRLHKAPRPFSFAVKSTDKLSFFENTADYLHIFSCGEKEGAKWMERILLARSYVLYQERNVLFNPKAVNNNSIGSAALSRAGTRKMSSAHRPPQPLISGITPPLTVAQQLQSSDIFELGSLLRKHA